MNDEVVTTTLVFYVNGRKVIDSNPDPGETLLTYLRNKLRSPSAFRIHYAFILRGTTSISFEWIFEIKGVGTLFRLILIKLWKKLLEASNKFFRKCCRNKILLQ